MMMFQHSQEAAVQVGWVVAVGSQGVGSLPECLIVHLCDPSVLFQGIWAHTGEGSYYCCCLQAAAVGDRWVVQQVHPGSNG